MHTTDAGTIILVRHPSPPPAPGTQPSVGRMDCLLNDEPIRIYETLRMHPWVMQACHFTSSSHLRTSCTLRFYRWIGVGICTHGGLCNCLKCQERRRLRQVVRWPTVTTPARNRRQERLRRSSPGIASTYYLYVAFHRYVCSHSG